MLKKKLNRRRFLQAGGAGLTGLTLLRNLPAGINAQTIGTSERRIYSIITGGFIATGAKRPKCRF
jgi:hypothetical protein